MRQHRTISKSMERPHSPKISSSPAAPTPFPRCWRISAHSRGTLTASLPATSVTSVRTLLLTLLRGDSIDLSPVYSDCGSLIFGDEQDAHAGGSGCGCSAAVLCGPLLRDMHRGKIHRLVFAGTGAMMSPTSVQQGQPIAGICHAVVLERSEA